MSPHAQLTKQPIPVKLGQPQHAHLARSMADDWCDYARGMQKRYDPNTGETSKTNSAYSYDWINEDGKRHKLSNDINFNPNGLGTGNWTQTTNVH